MGLVVTKHVLARTVKALQRLVHLALCDVEGRQEAHSLARTSRHQHHAMLQRGALHGLHGCEGRGGQGVGEEVGSMAACITRACSSLLQYKAHVGG
jgi:hypothetical protein